MGGLQEKLSKEVTQKISVSKWRIELLSQSVEEQKKSVADTNELLKNLMIGIENPGDNMKNIQKEMNYWRNPEILEAEEELGRL